MGCSKEENINYMNLPPLIMPESLKPSVPKKYLLRYPREYERAMKVIGRKEWITLKKKLSSPDAEKVVIALNTYVDTILATNKTVQKYDELDVQSFLDTKDKTTLRERLDTIRSLRVELRYAHNALIVTRYDLMALLVGKEHLCFEPPLYDSDE